MLRVTSVLGNSQRLDGGAMFGNVPRALWSRWAKPDELSRIELACRAILIDDGSRKVLLETGIGAFFEPKLRERFGVVEPQHVLLEGLARQGLSHEQIDAVVLSHLHFDHAGGLLAEYAPDKPPRLLFPNAKYIVSQESFERAESPHPRDRASFIPGLNQLLAQSGRLELVAKEGAGPRRSEFLGDNYQFLVTNGHTPGMLHTWLMGEARSIFFCADLVPGEPWVHVPITMGYDRYPELLIDEKLEVFKQLLPHHTWLCFTHDPETAAGELLESGGRYSLGAKLTDQTLGLDLDEPPEENTRQNTLSI